MLFSVIQKLFRTNDRNVSAKRNQLAERLMLTANAQPCTTPEYSSSPGRRKDFFQGGQKWLNSFFPTQNEENNLFLLKIQGGKAPRPPCDAHGSTSVVDT